MPNFCDFTSVKCALIVEEKFRRFYIYEKPGKSVGNERFGLAYFYRRGRLAAAFLLEFILVASGEFERFVRFDQIVFESQVKIKLKSGAHRIVNRIRDVFR